MKRLILLTLVAGAVTLGLPSIVAQTTNQTNAYHRWWLDRPFGKRFSSSGTNALPLIRVQGNRFVNPDGKAVLFRGLAISDPDKIEHQGHWNRTHFEKVREMGVTLVRIPVHPVAWRERTPTEYLKLLDQAVDWCTDLGMYVDIDWHTIGNLKMELFQDPMYNTTQRETFEFWRVIAQHYRSNTTVAFYELFNEPTLARGMVGRMTWSEWKKLNEDMIHLIRSYDADTIPLVAGLDWAYDLTPLLIEPIEAEGIAYSVHPYAQKRPKPWEPKWEVDFGFAAARYPVVASEFGFSVRKDVPPKEGDYPPAIINYLEDKGISWIGWVFDPEWGPSLLKSRDYELTGAGEYFKKELHERAGK
jgi:endoglucanase